MTDLDIELLPPADADDAILITRLTTLINEVYRVAGDGMWTAGADRTTEPGVCGLVRAGELAVARWDGHLVGCVRIQSLDPDTGEFGLLAADPARRGQGIGRALVRFAEEQARRRGHRAMQLELLLPQAWVHPAKQVLADWYDRLGYVVTGKEPVGTALPDLAPLLATECDFLIYRKVLTAP